ncbi:MAG: DsbA family oxidoreductase [Pseudonocardiaceae bacterium]
MRVDVFSDLVCPWCYIGKRRFERAVRRWQDGGGESVELVWRPFQLDPSAVGESVPYPQVLAVKYGIGAHGAQEMIDRISAVATGEGLHYRLAEARRSNTFEAHRVLEVALDRGGPPLQGAIQELLFRAQHCEAADLGDPTVLAGLAAEAGLDGAAEVVAGDEAADQVRAELERALAIGVHSVPTFAVAGRAVAGAREPEVLLELLRTATSGAVSE